MRDVRNIALLAAAVIGLIFLASMGLLLAVDDSSAAPGAAAIAPMPMNGNGYGYGETYAQRRAFNDPVVTLVQADPSDTNWDWLYHPDTRACAGEQAIGTQNTGLIEITGDGDIAIGSAGIAEVTLPTGATVYPHLLVKLGDENWTIPYLPSREHQTTARAVFHGGIITLAPGGTIPERQEATATLAVSPVTAEECYRMVSAVWQEQAVIAVGHVKPTPTPHPTFAPTPTPTPHPTPGPDELWRGIAQLTPCTADDNVDVAPEWPTSQTFGPIEPRRWVGGDKVGGTTPNRHVTTRWGESSPEAQALTFGDASIGDVWGFAGPDNENSVRIFIGFRGGRYLPLSVYNDYSLKLAWASNDPGKAAAMLETTLSEGTIREDINQVLPVLPDGYNLARYSVSGFRWLTFAFVDAGAHRVLSDGASNGGSLSNSEATNYRLTISLTPPASLPPLQTLTCDYHTMGEELAAERIGPGVFHKADRVHGNDRTLVLPECIDHGQPPTRYVYAAPAQYDPLRRVGLESNAPNQVAAWTDKDGGPLGSFVADVGGSPVIMSLYESHTLLDCHKMSGVTMEVYP